MGGQHGQVSLGISARNHRQLFSLSSSCSLRLLIAALYDQGDCIIPTDVFAVIAEILAGSRDLETLAHLNIASRQIHAGTLPVLYETLVFSDEKALSNAFKRPPLGWKYTK